MPNTNYFSAEQFQMEGSGFKNTMKKIFKRTENMWNIFFKPGLKIATPITSAGVAAKTKNSQSAAFTSNILKSLTSGTILSSTDIHGEGLRIKVMRIYFKKNFVIKSILVLKFYMITT